MTRAHVWDASTDAALDAVKHKYESKGKTVTTVGVNPDSAPPTRATCQQPRRQALTSVEAGPGCP